MTQERLAKLMQEARQLEPTPAQVQILEEAVRLADTLGDIEQAYEVRMELVHSTTFAGYKEKSLVAFTWCLAQFDKEPDNFDAFDLLWKFKWIVDQLPSFPQISRQQIQKTQDEMEARYLRADFSLRPVHYMRWSNHMHMGDLPLAQEFVTKWQRAPRDEMADCHACELNKHVELLIHLRRDEEAVEMAAPLFAGRLSCANVPDETYGLIVRPLLRLQRLDEAMSFYEKGYRRLRKNRSFLNAIAEQLLALVHARELGKAVGFLERHLAWALETNDLWNRLLFYSAASTLASALAERPGKSRKLRLPTTFPLHREDGTYVSRDLADWFDRETRALADRFNQRNGNDYVTQLVAESRRLAKVA
jgi:hypothetical protein